MTYLLDTSVWFRGAAEPSTLPAPLRQIIETPDSVFGLSAISLWEIAKKHQKGKLLLRKGLAEWLTDSLGANIEVLPLDVRIVTEAMALPEFPNHDPADELIVATARSHRLTILTTDTVLKNYRHARIRYFKPILEPDRN
jgi:PIN domain nuclease of toxin-antitoxin system